MGRECSKRPGCFKGAAPEVERRMAMEEPGIDRHEWETEWQALEPLIQDSPEEALPELDSLVERMLREEGYPVDDGADDEGVDPEVLASFRVARGVARQVDAGMTVDPGDVGHAVGLYRELYEHVLGRQHSTE
jgi:hypothetical protein